MKTALLILAFLPRQDKDQSKDPEIRQVTVAYENASLTAIFADLEKRTGIPISISEAGRKAVDPDKTLITTRIQDLSLYKVLYLILRNHGLKVCVTEDKKVLITANP